jgi:hypothetical protein
VEREVGGDQETERWGWGKLEGVGSGGSVWRDRDADERGVERGDGKKTGEVGWRWRFREVGEVEYEATTTTAGFILEVSILHFT